MGTLRIAQTIALSIVVLTLPGTAVVRVSFADPVTVTFTAIPAANDPVNLGPSNGTFTFDSGLVPPGEGLMSSPLGLATSVSFSWGGTSFDLTIANLGELRFDASGQLIHWIVGGVSTGLFAWVASPAEQVVDDFAIAPSGFFYTLRGREGTFRGGVLSDTPPTDLPPPAPVPEPSTWLLLGSGLAVITRRWRGRSPSESC